MQTVIGNSNDGLDQAEHWEELAGIAFVALQRYLASADASFRRTFGTVDAKGCELREQDCPSHTIEALAALGISQDTEFPCLVVLRRLAGNNTGALARLLDAVSDWREAVFSRLHSLAAKQY